jgi:hypothetical protein
VHCRGALLFRLGRRSWLLLLPLGSRTRLLILLPLGSRTRLLLLRSGARLVTLDLVAVTARSLRIARLRSFRPAFVRLPARIRTVRGTLRVIVVVLLLQGSLLVASRIVLSRVLTLIVWKRGRGGI